GAQRGLERSDTWLLFLVARCSRMGRRSVERQAGTGLRLQSGVNMETCVMPGAHRASGLDSQHRAIAFPAHVQLDQMLKSFRSRVPENRVQQLGGLFIGKMAVVPQDAPDQVLGTIAVPLHGFEALELQC